MIAFGAIEAWDMPGKNMTILGLSLIAIGSGCIRACVAAFGGDQFVLPQQAAQLSIYFSMFYASINFGSLVGAFVAPLLREDVQCFEMEDCFPAGFGMPAILMFISIIVFASGKFLYKPEIHQGNVILDMVKCICVSSFS